MYQDENNLELVVNQDGKLCLSGNGELYEFLPPYEEGEVVEIDDKTYIYINGELCEFLPIDDFDEEIQNTKTLIK